ncbi:MAG: LysR substrate-binding domain-containing protein [Pseudomonadota bacterium]
MAITLRQMQYFVALAEAGSFGSAAAQVFVTQPALSQQIKELERDLGAVLVERLPRGVRLTQAGKEALGRMRTILADVQDLASVVTKQDDLSGELRLGVIPTVAPYLLPPVLSALRASETPLQLRIREAQTGKLLQDLENGHLDAVIAVAPGGPSSLSVIPLFSDGFLLAGAASDLADVSQGPEALRPTKLDPDRLLLLDEGHCLADQALDVCDLTRGQTRVDLGASSLSTLCGLVARGFGLTFLPEIAVNTETQAQPDLALRRFAAPQPERTLALLRRGTAPVEGRFEALADLFRQAGHDLLEQAKKAPLHP